MSKKKPNTTASNFSLGENAVRQKKLKICGMKYNTLEVAQLQPDFLGFIFYEKSPRHFEGDIPKLPNSIKKVGVFVNASLEYVISKVKKHGLQAIQLHGQESPEYCLALKHHYEKKDDNIISKNEILNQVQHDKKVKIFKAFSIKDQFDFSALKPYEDIVDYYLFDTKGKLPGGNGYTFNWDVLKNYPSTKPYFLSGGIGLDEIDKLLSFLRRQESKYCHAIDINSKFETKPGLKHIEDLKAFKTRISF